MNAFLKTYPLPWLILHVTWAVLLGLWAWSLWYAEWDMHYFIPERHICTDGKSTWRPSNYNPGQAMFGCYKAPWDDPPNDGVIYDY